jgi:hypothetical protein
LSDNRTDRGLWKHESGNTAGQRGSFGNANITRNLPELHTQLIRFDPILRSSFGRMHVIGYETMQIIICTTAMKQREQRHQYLRHFSRDQYDPIAGEVTCTRTQKPIII